jgi:hypothetical protein
MTPEPQASKPPKVAIFDRPASADRPRRAWLPWAVAVAVASAWGVYFFWLR